MKKIAIVDDDQNLVETIQDFLEDEGFQTAVAYDGAEIQSLLQKFEPDLMILDIQMPKISGTSVIEFYKGMLGSNFKILVISGTGMENLEKTLAVGADAILQKPFENKQLLEWVTNLL